MSPMNPARWAQRQSSAVCLVTALLAIGGALALASLPSSIYPPLKFSRIVVIAHTGTLPAHTMMLTVARPIEQALMEVPGIRRVRSTTFRGATEVWAQFASTVDMAFALQQAQNRIAEVRGSMPADLDLTVERLTPAVFPVLSLNVTGGLTPAELHDAVYYVIRPALSRVPGVGRVEVLSSDTREIEVIVDPAKLLAAHLTAGEVADALRTANTLAPVGRFASGGRQHLVLVSGLWDSIARIGETPVLARPGATRRSSTSASRWARMSSRSRTGSIARSGRWGPHSLRAW